MTSSKTQYAPSSAHQRAYYSWLILFSLLTEEELAPQLFILWGIWFFFFLYRCAAVDVLCLSCVIWWVVGNFFSSHFNHNYCCIVHIIVFSQTCFSLFCVFLAASNGSKFWTKLPIPSFPYFYVLFISLSICCGMWKIDGEGNWK